MALSGVLSPVAHIGEELRLVLACDRELAALLLDLAEEPRVLDGDRRLVGKGRQQIDLLFGERLALRCAEPR